MIEAFLPFLLRNWKLVGIGLCVCALIAHLMILHGEVSHYKKLYEKETARYTLYVAQAQEKQAKLEAGAEEISKRHEHALAEADAQRERANKETKQRIAANEELQRTRISLAAVQLLNESTGHTEEPAPPIQGDAGSPAGTQASISVPLSVVFDQVAENNKNHLACTERLKDWISFWHEYEAVVKDATDARP